MSTAALENKLAAFSETSKFIYGWLAAVSRKNLRARYLMIVFTLFISASMTRIASSLHWIACPRTKLLLHLNINAIRPRGFIFLLDAIASMTRKFGIYGFATRPFSPNLCRRAQ